MENKYLTLIAVFAGLMVAAVLLADDTHVIGNLSVSGDMEIGGTNANGQWTFYTVSNRSLTIGPSSSLASNTFLKFPDAFNGLVKLSSTAIGGSNVVTFTPATADDLEALLGRRISAPTPIASAGISNPTYTACAHQVSSVSAGSITSTSITVAGSGAILVVCVGEYGSTISGVATSNGQNLTKLNGINNFDAAGKSELWYIQNPTAGAQTVTATFASNVTESAISVILCNNVTAITAGATTGGNITRQTSFTASVPSAVNDLAGSGVVYVRPAFMFTPTGKGHLLRDQANNASPRTSTLLSTTPGVGGSTALGWTVGGTGSEIAELTFNLH